jgi:tetratricopeptide (TPR) repeat protein
MDKRMARRYFNWTLAIVLVVAAVVFGAAVFTLHRWQKSTRAERSLPRGDQAYAEGNWDEAADQFGRYLSVRNDDLPVLLKYADAQRKRRPVTQGHLEHAITTYQTILRMDAGNGEAAKGLVELLLIGGRSNEARDIASKYLQSRDDPELRRMLAGALVQQLQYRRAATTLMDLIRDHPDAISGYEMLGVLARDHAADVNDIPPADWFDKAVAANPQSAMAYIVRGAFHRRERRREQAQADFDQAAKCDLSNVDTRLRLAQELILMKAFDKSREQLTLLQVKAPKNVSLWQSWAAVVLAGGSAEEKAAIAERGLRELAAYPWDFMATAAELFAAANLPERAEECITRMRQRSLQPELLPFLDGLVAASRGNLWEAAARWRDAVGQGLRVYRYAGGLGNSVPVRRMLASAYTQLGDIESAKVQLQALITEEPSSIMGVEGRMDLARLMITRLRDWTGALEQVREVLRLVPGYLDARLLEMQARILLLGDTEESSPNREQDWRDIEKQLAQLDQDMGGSVQVKLLLAQAMSKQGKSAEAIELLDDVRSTSPSDLRATLLEAEVLVGQDKVAEATTLLRGAMAQLPQAVEPVRGLALLLSREKDPQWESVLRQAIGRMQQPEARRELGLLLASLYRFWSRQDDLYQWLTDMAGQFPNDLRIKRELLTCPAVAGNTEQAQKLVDQIKSLEGQAGWQWRYEQAKLWMNPAAGGDPNVFRARYYVRTVELLQQNLLANPNDHASRLLLAMAHEKAGQQQLALSAYREALRRAPNDIVVIMQAVAALQRNGEQEEADQALRHASERQLDDPELVKLGLQGQRMLWRDQARRGALDSALATLQQLVQKEPNDVDSRRALATIYMVQGKLDDAEVILKGLEAMAPDSISIARTMVQLYMLRGNGPEAVRLCDATVQKTNQAAAYLLRAQTYAGLREFGKAEDDFSQAIARDSNNAAIWVARARFRQLIGRRDEAIQDARKALSLSTDNLPVLNDAIPLCLTFGSPRLAQEAEAALDKARAAEPSNPELKVLKAQFLLNRGTRPSIEEGQKLLREVTTAKPQLPQAWHLLGRVELERKEPGRALDLAVSGLSHNEQNRDLLLLKADAEEARSPVLAVPTLRSLLKQYPNDVQVERRLAQALYKSGDKSEGRSILEARMKADPNNPIAPATLALLLASDGRWTEVSEQVTSWVAKHPDDSFVVVTTASALMTQNGPEAQKLAESMLASAKKRNPKSIPAITSLAMVVQQMGRTVEAKALNSRVLELDPNSVVALNNLAWILCERDGQYQEALELADRGLKVAPDYMDLLDTRGVVLYRLGRFDKSAEDLARCIELYQDNAKSLASAYFHLARADAKMERTEQARERLKQAMDRAKDLSLEDQAEAKALLEQLREGR